MIGFFPPIYSDELLYSQLCRYYVRTGYPSYIASADDLYSKRTIHPDIEFINKFNDDALRWITQNKTFDEIIIQHTMFPAYARFLPKNRKSAAYTALLKMEGNWRNPLAIPHTGERFLMFCPECARSDRKNNGEAYWHRQHQIQRIRICPEHRCFLIRSNVKIGGKASPGFYAAEQNIPFEAVIEPCKNNIEIKLVEYMTEVMSSPIEIEADSNIGMFLHSRLPDAYINKSGLVRNTAKLFADFNDFYCDIDRITEIQIQKLLNGYRYDFFSVCQFAFFEGISVDELSHIPSETEPSGIEKLYRKLSAKHNVDYDIVKDISDSVLTFVRKSTVQKSSGPRAIKWDKLDRQMLPQVTAFIDDFYKSIGRPKKLSFSIVQKELNLPQKQIGKLPLCKKYIEDHMETQEQYWAREIEWAIDFLGEDDCSVNKICKLINIKKIDFQRCLPYITQKKHLKILENIR